MPKEITDSNEVFLKKEDIHLGIEPFDSKFVNNITQYVIDVLKKWMYIHKFMIDLMTI